MEEQKTHSLVVIQSEDKKQLEELLGTLSKIEPEIGDIVEEGHNHSLNFDPLVATTISKLIIAVAPVVAKELIAWVREDILMRKKAAEAENQDGAKKSEASLIICVNGIEIIINSGADPSVVSSTLEAALNVKTNQE